MLLMHQLLVMETFGATGRWGIDLHRGEIGWPRKCFVVAAPRKVFYGVLASNTMHRRTPPAIPVKGQNQTRRVRDLCAC